MTNFHDSIHADLKRIQSDLQNLKFTLDLLFYKHSPNLADLEELLKENAKIGRKIDESIERERGRNEDKQL